MLNIVNKTVDKSYRKYDEDLHILFNDIISHFELDENDLTVILVKDKYMRKINKQYRNKDYATDVISFANEDDSLEENYNYLGDIFINVEATNRQAIQLGHSYRREYSFLFMHGMLHCLGFDHIKKEDEVIMIEKQKEIIEGRTYLDEEI